MCRFESKARRIARQVYYLLKFGKDSIHSLPVSLPETEAFRADRTPVSPLLRIGKKYFLKPSIVKISRDQGTVAVELHHSLLSPRNFEVLVTRLFLVFKGYSLGLEKMLDQAERARGRAIIHLDLSDGGLAEGSVVGPEAGLFAFSRRKSDRGIGLVPDPYTLSDLSNHVEFEVFEDELAAKAEYDRRKDLVFWRGSTTGGPVHEDIMLNPRVRFCVEGLNFPGLVDARITNVVQFPSNQAAFKALSRAGVMSAPVSEAEFRRYKTTIDLDGNASAWGTLRKYLGLVHVLKPASRFEMFYHVDQPPETFTAVENPVQVFQRIRECPVPGLVDNFPAAWQGYRFALEIQDRIGRGEATVFPCR